MKNRGFTLIELSMVLVIIGMVLGGIIGGRELVRQSEIQKTGALLEQFERVTNTFVLQYKYLPGDIDGDRLWNCSDVLPSNTCRPPSTTLNNGLLDVENKALYFWVHLRKSRLLQGSLNMGDRSNFLTIPQIGGRIGVERWAIYGIEENYLVIGGLNPGYPTWPKINYSGLKVDDGYFLDVKFDDGLASNGKILVTRGIEFHTATDRCTNQSSSYVGRDVRFLFDDTSVSCRLFYRLDIK